jgi:hypothetical protein
MTIHIFSSVANDYVLSMEYDETGLEWVRIYDNICLGWAADDAGAVPVQPVIIGSLPTAAPDTAPILSPQWGHVSAGGVMIPDVWRGSGGEFLDWLSGNNGASRKIEARLTLQSFAGVFESWKFRNPHMAA